MRREGGWDVRVVEGALVGEKVVGASCSMGQHHPHTLVLAATGRVYSCGDGGLYSDFSVV